MNTLDPLGEAPEEVRWASREAGERLAGGEASGLDAEDFTWPGEGQTPSQLRKNPDVPPCFARIGSGRRRGDLCDRPAGWGTSHPGVGRCRRHGGETEEGLREGAWVVGHAFARALDVTPWEGLLTAVRIAAGRVAFCEAKLAGAWSDRQLEPPVTEGEDSGAAGRVGEDGQNLHYWVKQAELWHDKLARVSKLAIDAGVAERLVRQLELEAAMMIQAANAGLDAAGIEGHAREVLLRAMSAKLLELESGSASDAEVS